MRLRTEFAKRGFTLLELVIVLAVMAVLAGVLVPVVKQVLDAAKVTKLVTLVDSLAQASRRYYKDTRNFAKEFGQSSLASEHQLAYDQGGAVKDWNGPYIEGPLMDSMQPFENAQIQLLPTLLGIPGSGGSGSGYYLAGLAGPQTLSTSGQEVYLGALATKWAEKINEAFDGPDEGADAATAGRVIYQDNSGACEVYIFVLDPYGSAK